MKGGHRTLYFMRILRPAVEDMKSLDIPRAMSNTVTYKAVPGVREHSLTHSRKHYGLTRPAFLHNCKHSRMLSAMECVFLSQVYIYDGAVYTYLPLKSTIQLLQQSSKDTSP